MRRPTVIACRICKDTFTHYRALTDHMEEQATICERRKLAGLKIPPLLEAHQGLAVETIDWAVDNFDDPGRCFADSW